MALGSTFSERAVASLSQRVGRRGFLSRSAVVGSALVAAPTTLLLRPGTAYAAVCGCRGSTCTCASLCCDGYTEFCCALYGVNALPHGIGHRAAGGRPTARASAVARPATTWTAIALRRVRLRWRRHLQRVRAAARRAAAATAAATTASPAARVPLRQLQQPAGVHRADPVPRRELHRTVDARATLLVDAVRTDNNTRSPQPHVPPGGSRRSTRSPATGTARQATASASTTTATASGRSARPPTRPRSRCSPFGKSAGDLPVVGDWDGDGRDGVGIFRAKGPRGTCATTASAGSGTIIFRVRARRQRDIPVVGDWNGDGVDSIGIFRRGGHWYLRDTRRPGTRHRHLRFGMRPPTSPSSATGTATASTASASSARGCGTSDDTPTPGASLARLRVRRRPATSRSSATGTASASSASASTARRAAPGTCGSSLDDAPYDHRHRSASTGPWADAR